MYADSITDSMKIAIDETERRREIQRKYNEEHGITPTTIKKNISNLIEIGAKDASAKRGRKQKEEKKEDVIEKLRAEMKKAASELRFEEAAYLRDKIKSMEISM